MKILQIHTEFSFHVQKFLNWWKIWEKGEKKNNTHDKAFLIESVVNAKCINFNKKNLHAINIDYV